MYQFFLPHKYIIREKLIESLQNDSFTVECQLERGILLAPVFSNIITLFFDAIDRFLLQKRGELGFFGKTIRKLFYPLLALEQKLSIDFGHTLFVRARKNS